MDNCAICYNTKKLVFVNCKHSFCKLCLRKIILSKIKDETDNTNVLCPMCRQDVTKTNNKCVNRELNHYNITKINRQSNGCGLTTTELYVEFNKKNKINKYPRKNKFYKKR